MATAIAIMYHNNELTYSEAINALKMEAKMTHMEAINFLYTAEEGDF